MSICWYCHWGWADPVADIYQKAIIALDSDSSPLHFGPSHIVWDDENFDSAEWCLANFDGFKDDYTEQELEIVHQSLIELAALPMSQREIVPEDYDGENPQNYPPQCSIKKVKV